MSHHGHDARNLRLVGRYDDAERSALAALRDQPDVSEWHVLLAQIRLDLGRPADALGGLDIAPQTATLASGLQVRSQAYRALGRWDDAVAAIDAAISLQPEQPHLHTGRALALLGGDSPATVLDDARRSLDTAAALDPALALVPYCRALCCLTDSDLPGAARHLEAAITLEPEWAAAHHLAASVRASQGMVRLASRHLAAAGRLDPRSDEPLRALRRLGGIRQRRWRRASRSADAPRLAADAEEMLERDLRLLRGDI